MIGIALYPRSRKHSGGWIAPDTRTMTTEIEGHEFPEIVAIIGPAGPAGPPGVVARYDQSLAGTWIIAHGLGRVPIVQIYDAAGNLILTDIVADAIHITATFATPQAGFALAS